MQSSFVFLCLLAQAHASQIEVTPVQKVVSLLTEMLDKAKRAKTDERSCFAKEREEVCSDKGMVVQLTKSIRTEEQAITSFTAAIRKYDSDAHVVEKKIGKLNVDTSTWKAEKIAAKKVRKTGKADYATTHKDYSESIDAIDKAIAELKRVAQDHKKAGSSLAQVPALASLMDLGLVPANAKREIDLFLQQGEEESALVASKAREAVAPEKNGYEFQSSGVVDMLEKLQDKFVDEKTNIEQEEANAKSSHALMIQDLDAQIEQGDRDIGDKQTEKAEEVQASAHASSDLREETTLKKVDTTTLVELKSSCAMKSSDFEARQKLRDEEVLELQKVLEIVNSGSVAGLVQKHMPALMQKRSKATSFVAMNKGEKVTEVLKALSNTKIQDRVVEFLRMRAAKLNSRVLKTVAKRAAADPFGKVKKMLQDLVVRLMEEANEETVHKGWCDKELGANAHTRKDKSDEVETLESAIDELSASISKIDLNTADLNKEIADIDKAVSAATEARKCETTQNTEAIKDSQEAQTSIAQATSVLKAFYANAAQATSLVQQPYTGLQELNAGVLAHLEIIESDFGRLGAEAKASEATAQKLYDDYLGESRTDKTAKNTAIEHKAAKKTAANQALTGKKRDLEDTQKVLDAALTYFEKLKPSCVDAGVSYEDRVQRRKEEIESLQEALKVMNGEELAGALLQDP